MPLTVRYGTHKLQVVDLWGYEGTYKGDVLFIPGGGYGDGEGHARSKVGDEAKRFAKWGYRSSSMSYRGTDSGVFWPGLMDDVRACQDFLTARFAATNRPVGRWLSYGMSAGGLLGQWLAIEGRVAKHINVSGPCDLTQPEMNNRHTRTLCPDGNYVPPSPALHVLPGTAPTQLWFGTQDTVPHSQGVIMKAAMDAVGSFADLQPAYKGGHCFDGVGDTARKAIRFKNTAFYDAL